MYDQEESFWFNHVLLTHFDKQFQTSSYLRLSISISTNDFLRFGQPFLAISISNSVENTNRTYSLNIQNCSDLIKVFRQVVDNSSQLFVEKFQIIRKYNKDKSLIFNFFEESNNKEKLVKIQIFHNESNFGSVIIDYSLFKVLAIQMRTFVSDYIKIGGDIRRDFISSRLLQVNDKLLKDIRNLPNQLLEQDVGKDTRETDLIEDKPTVENELYKYIGGDDMSKVNLNLDEEVSLVTKPKEKIQIINSNFIDKVINRDLSNLESFFNSSVNTSMNPLESITKELQTIDSNMILLPGISKKDLKLITYLSKLFYSTHYQNYLENDISIPLTTSILKYNTDDVEVKNENIDLAYDLLTVMGYLKCFRNKVESKEADVFVNKSLVYLAFRCFIDIFIFSFLTKKLVRTDTLLSNIESRFKYFDSIGIFDSYKKELENNNCSDIDENEIYVFVQQVIEGPIESSPCIDKFYNDSAKHFRLPPDNDFTIEQIINDVVPIEVNEKLGKSIDEVLIDKSDEIKKLFKSKVISKQNDSKRKSNLLKYISQHTKEDSEIYKAIDGVHEKDKNFDFNELEIVFEEIDEAILKALFLWEPENDIKVKQNYNYFVNKIDEEIMTKDLIITKLRNDVKSDMEWNFDLV